MRIFGRFSAVFAVIITFFLSCGCTEQTKLPEQISLLITGENKITAMDFKEYLCGCIFATTQPSLRQETLNAAAAAICGRAVYSMENRAAGDNFGADLSDDIQPWISIGQAEREYSADFEKYSDKVSQAADFALENLPTYEGKAADTRVCILSSGVTDNGGKPYLPSIRLDCDKKSPDYKGKCTVTPSSARKSIYSLTGKVILPPDKKEWFTDKKYTDGGVLISVKFGGKEITGEQLCKIMKLRSAAIEIEYLDEMFVFSTKGIGDNIGMSVYAAERLARQGKTAEDIIAFFFPEVELI